VRIAGANQHGEPTGTGAAGTGPTGTGTAGTGPADARAAGTEPADTGAAGTEPADTGAAGTESAGTGAAAGTAGQPQPDPAARRSARRRRMWITLSLVAVLLIGVNTYATYVLVSQRNATAGAGLRPSGIPGNISTSTANLMQLSPVPPIPAPGFRLTDQRGHTMTLASLRGKVVVLEFMDPHCTDICPIVSQEYIDAYHRLGAQTDKVVFAAINVNQYHASVQDMAAYSDAHRLNAIPSWHFFTGPVPALHAVWHHYNVAVQAPNPDADIIHSSAVYFIDANGTERFMASPMVDHTANGKAYLPLAQVSDWSSGIARLASNLARSAR
jgi:cytochrome oxidase Cu insertion factor (SCO1/SenC/PrrC family)